MARALHYIYKHFIVRSSEDRISSLVRVIIIYTSLALGECIRCIFFSIIWSTDPHSALLREIFAVAGNLF